MRRIIIWTVALVAALGLMLSCNVGGGNAGEGQAYHIKGTVALDSSQIVDNKLVLFTDNHRTLVQDTIFVTQEGTFEHEGHTQGFDELYLCGEEGELCRFYASGNMEVNLSLTSSEEGVKVQFHQLPTDTINGWLQEKKASLEGLSSRENRNVIESLIRENPTDMRVSLLLRDQIAAINDSLYIRQSLGSLKEEAKPDWMKKSIDQTLNVLGSGKKSSYVRLPGATFELADTIIDLASSRSDYLLVCFWADYSKPSIDTLRALAGMIKRDYEGKRVSFMSCCLHAEDSAMWRVRSNFLDGSHTWVKGGFSDPRMRAWNIQQVPSVILMDMYCNQTQRDVWGEDLRRALDRLPNRIGYPKK